MTDKQPEALRLAARIHCGDDQCKCSINQAAVELRRLHEVNAELMESLKFIVPPTDKYDYVNWIAKAKAALAKATGENNDCN